MSFDRIESIESLSPGFIEGIVKYSGRPHNFVDSAEGSFVGWPDMETDPDALAILRASEDQIAGLGKTAISDSDK